MQKLARFIASGGGSGFLPKAPGTWGSLVGLVIVLILSLFPTWCYVVALVAACVNSWWASGECLKKLADGSPSVPSGKEMDPPWIVADEICGMLVTFLFIPPTPLFLLTGFLLFRLFDIWKPLGIRRVERVGGALGILLDDLVAGFYANLLLQGILFVT